MLVFVLKLKKYTKNNIFFWRKSNKFDFLYKKKFNIAYLNY